MRTTNKTISGLTFHGTTIRTRISSLIDLLGEPAGGSGYGRTAMAWRAATDSGRVFCIFKEAGTQLYRRRHWLVFQILAKDGETAKRALAELQENLVGKVGEVGKQARAGDSAIREEKRTALGGESSRSRRCGKKNIPLFRLKKLLEQSPGLPWNLANSPAFKGTSPHSLSEEQA